MIADRPPPCSKVRAPALPISARPCSPAKAGAQTGSPPSRGNNSRFVCRAQPPRFFPSTPAKAGAQLGDGGNAGQHVVTTTSPPGPRPPPGRCDRCDLHDAICRYSTGCPQGDGTTPAKAGAQLGDGGNEGQRAVTATSPPGPRPPPGRCKGCGLHDANCRYSTSCPQGDGTTPAKAGA